MGFWSFVGSCCRAVGNAICSVASTVYNGVKSAVTWMAEKAEQFIGGVKTVWEVVKKYIKPALKIIQFIPWPPLQAAAKALEKAITFLEKIEKTVLATKLGKAINWTINAAQKIKTYILDEGERREAEERKSIFIEAKDLLPEEERKAIQIGEIINEFVLVQSEIQNIFDKNSVNDFEHYLRLRATQKLLKLTEESFQNGKDMTSIGKGELFLLEIGRELLKKDPHIDDTSMEMLNGMILKRYGKNLIPFIFEEMIASWSKQVEDLEKKWNERNNILIKQKVTLKPLQTKIKLGYHLTDIEKEEIFKLEEIVFAEDNDLKKIKEQIIERTVYVDAAEGFLQILEENEQIIGKTYLIEKGYDVGMIIIQCAEQDREWKSLSEDEKDLIIDYANIFREARIAREHAILNNTIEMAV